MFPCNKYNFKKISLPSNKKPTRSEKQYKQYKDSSIPRIKKKKTDSPSPAQHKSASQSTHTTLLSRKALPRMIS